MNKSIIQILQSAIKQQGFDAQVGAFLQYAQSLAQDGLTIAEIGQLFYAFIHLAVEAAEMLAGVPGQDKKTMVMAAVAQLYDVIAPYIPLPMVLSPFRGWLIPYLRKIVLAVADGAVEIVVDRLPDPLVKAP